MTTHNDTGARLAMAERALKRAAIERALDTAGVIGADRDLVVDRMARFVVLTERDGELVVTAADDRGTERLASRGLPMTVDALAVEFREKFPRNFTSQAKAPIGATAAPAGSPWKAPNPFAAESRSLTEQGHLYRADPALYAKWKAEADGASASAPKPAAAPLTGDVSRFFRLGPDYSLTMQGRVYREDRSRYDAIKAAIGE
ncbi:hypothetical protein [Methylobacterium radiotolerans]|uniref:hypothetical protein n=1 Tax=Methylobacterium radiotolerans TaxID=31998 RepID=UPI0015F57C5B|nr:hypothetical protein [Methylobacterium radiotolerans]